MSSSESRNSLIGLLSCSCEKLTSLLGPRLTKVGYWPYRWRIKLGSFDLENILELFCAKAWRIIWNKCIMKNWFECIFLENVGHVLEASMCRGHRKAVSILFYNNFFWTPWPGLFRTIFPSQIYWWNLWIHRDPMYAAISPECWLIIVYCWYCWAPLVAVAWVGLSWYLWTVTFLYVQRLAQSALSYSNVWIANCINKNEWGGLISHPCPSRQWWQRTAIYVRVMKYCFKMTPPCIAKSLRITQFNRP